MRFIRISGKSSTDSEEDVFVGSESIGHPFDDVDLGIDFLNDAGVEGCL